jgi:hypothetical protein
MMPSGMVTRRDRRRFERAAARAIRPSRRASMTSVATIVLKLVTWTWSWSALAVAAILVVGVTVFWAFPSKIESRRAEAPAPAPTVAVSEPPRVEPPRAEPSRSTAVPRPDDARRAHLSQLQPVLRTDADKLSEVARRVRAEGRVTDHDRDRAAGAAELRSLFAPHRTLSSDLQNHFQEYSQAKERLRRQVAEQDAEFQDAAGLLTTKLSLSPDAEHRRPEVARFLLRKCLGGRPPAAADEQASLEAFTAFLAHSDVITHCESLTKRAARIAASADRLAAEAAALAERTTLPGDCKYTTAN